MSAETKKVLRWIERALFAFGLVAVCWCAFILIESSIFQRQENRNLERLVAARQTVVVDMSPQPNIPPARIAPGALIGKISVARLGLSVMVMEGTDAPILRLAAGHIPGTALPGQDGNIGIAAHRDTFFRPLRNIRKNDVITITTKGGDYRYRVVSTRIVSPDDVAVLNSDGSDVLTLVTCYPFYYIGSAPDRFIVRAEQIG